MIRGDGMLARDRLLLLEAGDIVIPVRGAVDNHHYDPDTTFRYDRTPR